MPIYITACEGGYLHWGVSREALQTQIPLRNRCRGLKLPIREVTVQFKDREERMDYMDKLGFALGLKGVCHTPEVLEKTGVF